MTEYAYRHPTENTWVGAWSSRDAAAKAMLDTHTRFTGGTTAPVLARRGTVLIVDRNSTVYFQKPGDGAPAHQREIKHDAHGLATARTK